MGIVIGLVVYGVSCWIVGFILGRAYQLNLFHKEVIELQDLRRHIRESNERAS